MTTSKTGNALAAALIELGIEVGYEGNPSDGRLAAYVSDRKHGNTVARSLGVEAHDPAKLARAMRRELKARNTATAASRRAEKEASS
jgi:hypothetical protein